MVLFLDVNVGLKIILFDFDVFNLVLKQGIKAVDFLGEAKYTIGKQ